MFFSDYEEFTKTPQRAGSIKFDGSAQTGSKNAEIHAGSYESGYFGSGFLGYGQYKQGGQWPDGFGSMIIQRASTGFRHRLEQGNYPGFAAGFP